MLSFDPGERSLRRPGRWRHGGRHVSAHAGRESGSATAEVRAAAWVKGCVC